MASPGNSHIYLQYDAYQVEHRLLPDTPGGAETLQVHGIRQHGNRSDLVSGALFLGYLPVQPCPGTVGLYYSEPQVCLGTGDSQRRLCPVCHDHRYGLALCIIADTDDMEGQDEYTDQGNGGSHPRVRYLVSCNAISDDF